MNILEAPLDAITIEGIEAFLADVSGESLTWEGKGHDSLTAQRSAIREQVCGFANQLGGLLIIGASQAKKGAPWTLPGVERGALHDDPHDWVCRVINDGLRDVPPYEVRILELGARLVVLIRVAASATPPCVTLDGRSWQRVVGETLRIKDPAILRDLIHRGDARHAETADTVARMSIMELNYDGKLRYGRVAVASTYVGPGIAGRMFCSSFEQLLLEVGRDLPLRGPGNWTPGIRQDGNGYHLDVGREISRWTAQVTVVGQVVMQYTELRHDVITLHADEIVQHAWSSSARLLDALVGAGDTERVLAYLSARFWPEENFFIDVKTQHQDGVRSIATPPTSLMRRVWLRPPSTDELDGIARELIRHGGLRLLETEPFRRA